MKTFIVLIIVLLSSCYIRAGSIKGIIVDEADAPVAGANIYLPGTILGTASAEEGAFIIKNIPAGEYTLYISMIGYEVKTIPVSLAPASVLDLGTIQILSIPLTSQPVVVTASRNRREIRDLPVSVSTVSAQEMDRRNAITVEDALKYLPGVNINASQVNIRGSNGYSRGVGSRVMMLVDGIPYLTGDTQETNLSSLPVHQIAHIEVVKGAGSALYGSNAMGGIINVITRNPADMPLLRFKAYGGFYSDPYYEQWQWSDRTRYLHGFKLNLAKQWDKTAVALFGANDRNDSMKKNDWQNRYHLGGKIQWTFSPYQTLTLSGAYMDQKRGNFLYWKNLDNALIPPDNQLDDRIHSRRFHLASSYRQVIDASSYYLLQGIWYRNRFEDNIDQGNKSISDFTDLEAQYTKKIEKHTFTSGLSLSSSNVEANIFGNRAGNGMAAYLQDEYLYTSQWQATLGVRFDYASIDSMQSAHHLSPKLGLLYKPNKTTTIRASAGSGYRAPSIAEAFTSTTASGIRVVPNPRLQPEESVAAEVGLNQLAGKQALFDGALFYSRYWNLIEARFTPQQVAQFNNVTRADIWGYELLFNYVLLPKKFHLMISFTHMEPRDQAQDRYLSFRPRYLFYTNLVGKLADINLGVDYRYISRYEEIDDQLAQIVEDARERVAAHIIDVRIQYNLHLSGVPVWLSLQINNVLQYHYTDLIGAIAPTRHFILALDTSL
jgi:outer membrane receptor for ferrienterochelin and colicins